MDSAQLNKMRIVFIVDARSPIAQNWIRSFIEHGHEVHIISSYPCASDILAGAKIYEVPIAFSKFSRVGHDGTIGNGKRSSLFTPLLASLRSGPAANWSLTLRHWLAPFDLYRHIKAVRQLIVEISPDLVHAMRIPFEGMLAAQATPSNIPLLVSVWGNDFTLFAKTYRLIGRQTRHVMRRADALHCDCQRDLQLAESWGFDMAKPKIVLPGAGGIRMAEFNSEMCESRRQEQLQIPENAPVVFNPRGFRNYVLNDTFFKAIPLVLQQRPDTIFICSAMQGNPIAEKWIAQLRIDRNIRLLPQVPHQRMADLFRLAQIMVSPSIHDGSPNTLLEGMSCGCFPIAGTTESLQEWIDDGVNGLLCDPTSPESLAQAILKALDDDALRKRARIHNLRLIAERADYQRVMVTAEQFYRLILERMNLQKKNILAEAVGPNSLAKVEETV